MKMLYMTQFHSLHFAFTEIVSWWRFRIRGALCRTNTWRRASRSLSSTRLSLSVARSAGRSAKCQWLSFDPSEARAATGSRIPCCNDRCLRPSLQSQPLLQGTRLGKGNHRTPNKFQPAKAPGNRNRQLKWGNPSEKIQTNRSVRCIDSGSKH